MKSYTSVAGLLLISLAIYIAFALSWPSARTDKIDKTSGFSTETAREHVRQISQFPHAVGFPGHRQVREYIVGELEKLGLTPKLQEGYTAGDWGNLSKATNIMARIEGSGDGNALVLLSHYDSNPHSSLGASDDASGIATILEGVRAFLAETPGPVNDIIILFTDAEELGLNGADLFVNHHPWAEDTRLVLNFEARGSGGPSYMLLETNRGNSRLIEEITRAQPKYPVGNSLAYSIYKLLPNDTDLTVFREDADIEGLNFAFIDDHYDYHTIRDNAERLDQASLAHQGSYLMPLLRHFSQADLGALKSLNDRVYFNVPFFKLVSYPYEWIWPIFIIASLLFIVLLAYGFSKKSLTLAGVAKGIPPALLILLFNGLLGYFGWKAILYLYPEYREILHGFPYNGHLYIAAFVFLSLAICFWWYDGFRSKAQADLLVAPIILWLCICVAMNIYLKGASFFIIPVFGLLSAFLVLLHPKDSNLFVLIALGIPALWMLAPMVQTFPVGLGMNMIITATLLTSLLFFLLLPAFLQMKIRWRLGGLSFLLFLGFLAGAHFNSGFNEEKPLPTSLVYLLDADSRKANWVTYDQRLSDWTSSFINPKAEKPKATNTSPGSKYGTGFTHVGQAPMKAIDAPQHMILRDSLMGDSRYLTIRIIPQRSVNRLEIHTSTPIESAKVNGIALSEEFLSQRGNTRLLTHYISDNTSTELEVSIPKGELLELTLYEASNDLLTHPLFSIPSRPANQIPKPFVLNDAILVKKTIRLE